MGKNYRETLVKTGNQATNGVHIRFTPENSKGEEGF